MNYPYTKYLIVVFLILLQSCGSKRPVYESSEPQPDWVRSRPITPGYYTGIGWAHKTQNVHQYQQTARQNAMADLAGEISVTISSNSVLHAFESSLGFREDFSSTIEARIQEELEGFEIVDTWEDQNNYWVYYSLSASRHREIKERRRSDAVSLSLGLLENALEERENGYLRLAMIQLINSMEAINNYFDDPLPVEFRDRNILLGNEIFNELSSTLSEIIITPGQSQVNIKRGQEVSSDILKFKVSSNSGPASDFPLLARYSERPVRNNRVRTGRDGYGHFSIDGVRSSAAFETFTVFADIEAILAETNSGPFTRRLIRRFSLPDANVRINILKPVIALKSKEENLDQEIKAGKLGISFRKNAMEAGYIINNDPEEADYIVFITANTIALGETGAYKNALLTGSISIKNNTSGNIIYHRELEGFRGSHFGLELAGEDAYQKAARRMESSFFREIDEAIRKGS